MGFEDIIYIGSKTEADSTVVSPGRMNEKQVDNTLNRSGKKRYLTRSKFLLPIS